MFDSSGDLQLNAKEFACGLSEICSSYQKGQQPDEVRRAFAFRYYDVDGQGLFEKKECMAHLKSYRLAAQRTVERQVRARRWDTVMACRVHGSGLTVS